MKPLKTDFLDCVPLDVIRKAWGEREYKRFLKWLDGQTMGEWGAFVWDVETYARQRNEGIKNPPIND